MLRTNCSDNLTNHSTEQIQSNMRTHHQGALLLTAVAAAFSVLPPGNGFLLPPAAVPNRRPDPFLARGPSVQQQVLVWLYV